MKRISLALLAFVLLLVLSACNNQPAPQIISITGIWARPGLAGSTSAVYFIIENPMAGKDVLKSASAESVAGMAELHISKMENGVMTMVKQESVPIEDKKVEFKAGGLHVMLMNLKKDLFVGDTFDLKLFFEKTGEVTVKVTVKQP